MIKMQSLGLPEDTGPHQVWIRSGNMMYLGASGSKLRTRSKRRKQFKQSQGNKKEMASGLLLPCPVSPGIPWAHIYLNLNIQFFLFTLPLKKVWVLRSCLRIKVKTVENSLNWVPQKYCYQNLEGPQSLFIWHYTFFFPLGRKKHFRLRFEEKYVTLRCWNNLATKISQLYFWKLYTFSSNLNNLWFCWNRLRE